MSAFGRRLDRLEKLNTVDRPAGGFTPADFEAAMLPEGKPSASQRANLLKMQEHGVSDSRYPPGFIDWAIEKRLQGEPTKLHAPVIAGGV